MIATPIVLEVDYESIGKELEEALERLNDRWAADLESS